MRNNKTGKIYFIAIIVLCLSLFFGCNKNEFDYSKFSFEEIDGGYKMTEKLSLFSNKRFEGTLKIPEAYKGKPIIRISSMGDKFGRGITKIIGSKNLEVIEAWTFASTDRVAMSNLKSVVFPEDGNLKTIETMAFYWSNNLETVVLPNGFEKIGDGAFEKCYNLKNLIIYNEIPPLSGGDIFNRNATLSNDKYWHTRPNASFVIFVPDSAIDAYTNSILGKYKICPISSFNEE